VVRPDRHALAEHGEALDTGVVADPHAAADDAGAQRAAGPDLGAPHDHGALHGRARPDGHAPLEHRAAADLRALADAAAALHERGGDDPAGRLDTGLHAEEGVAHPLRDLGAHGALEDVVGAVEVAGGRADVAPV